MLGWHVRVHRKRWRRRAPATFSSRPGPLLGQWQGSLGALEWLDELCTSGDATMTGGDGYPVRYTARCRDVRPVLLAGPPGAQEPWVHGEHDIIVDPSKWTGRTAIDRPALDACRPDEWLIVEAWDES